MVVRHNLGEFARKMGQRGADVEAEANKGMRRIALAVNQALVLATPVDTGRARANWQLSIGAEITSELDSTNVQGTLASNQALLQGYRGGALNIQNNLPYIKRLDEGWSSQAPAGFVAKAIQTGVRHAQSVKVVR